MPRAEVPNQINDVTAALFLFRFFVIRIVTIIAIHVWIVTQREFPVPLIITATSLVTRFVFRKALVAAKFQRVLLATFPKSIAFLTTTYKLFVRIVTRRCSERTTND